MASSAMNVTALETAFGEFNRNSARLEDSYNELQKKVSALNARLAQAEEAERGYSQDKERIENRLVRLLETLPGAVLVIDGSGIIRECNSRAADLLDTPLLGCAWSVIVNREFCRGASRDGELKLKDGRWLSLSRQSLGEEPGEIMLLADITESRRTADLLQRSERLSSIGEMTARLGHQIRTPLASALLYASTLEEIGTKEHREVAENITRRLRDLGSMVDDMLHFAAGAKNSGTFIRVTDILHEVADSIAPQLGSGSQIKIEIADTELGVTANGEALKGALLNLVCNSIQARPDDTVIELSCVKLADQVCLTVRDNGPGIAENIRARLFEPFFTTRPQGTGLGLAVVRSVAEAHGGDVLVESDSNGAAFSIFLPAAVAEADGSQGAAND